MADWKRTLLSPDSVIADAIKVIDDSALQICLVVDDTERLLGTVTDGDIRRGLLGGLGLEVPIDAIMKRDPLTAKPKTGREKLLAIMADSMLRQIPLLDADGRVVGLALIDESVPVIVLAPPGALFDKTLSNVQEVIARGGKVVFMSDEAGVARLAQQAWASVAMPRVDDFVAPLLYAIPVQLLAYHTAVVKGTDVDQPRNLAKSVTVE